MQKSNINSKMHRKKKQWVPSSLLYMKKIIVSSFKKIATSQNYISIIPNKHRPAFVALEEKMCNKLWKEKRTIPMLEQVERPEKFSHSKPHWEQWHPGKPKRSYSFCKGCTAHPYIDGQRVSFLYLKKYRKKLVKGIATCINHNYVSSQITRGCRDESPISVSLYSISTHSSSGKIFVLKVIQTSHLPISKPNNNN